MKIRQIKSLYNTLSYVEIKPRLIWDIFRILFLKKTSKRTSIPYPTNINLILTYRCNATCSFCFNQNLKKPEKDFSIKVLRKMLDELPEGRCYFLLTGGEPFLHKDIMKILYLIKKRKHSCGIVTNGSLLDKKKIQKLISLNLNYIIFSIHGLKDSHEEATGIGGSYKRIIEAIKLFNHIDKKKRCKIYINSVLTTENIHHTNELIDGVSSFRIDAFRISHLDFNTEQEMRYMSEHLVDEDGNRIKVNNYVMKNTDIEPEKVIKLLDSVRKSKIHIVFKPQLDKEEINEWYSSNNNIARECYFLYISISVDSNHDVLPCHHLNYVLGNAENEKLCQIWNNKKMQFLRGRINKELPFVCRRCCRI